MRARSGRRPWAARRWRALATAVLGLAAGTLCQAAALNFCDRPDRLSTAEQDRLLRLADAVRTVLDESGQRVALVARSGMDLSRLGQRYSHAGISLLASPNTPWSVRQLYYACDEAQPRLFDQGLGGFVLGIDDAAVSHVALVLLPDEAAEPLERAALDRREALALLGGRYSANAYPFSATYQNCNQWVAELMAVAWALPAAAAAAPAASPLAPRQAAQALLRAGGYQPTALAVGAPLMLLGLAVPHVHRDDHPEADLAAGVFRVSLPAALEAWARQRWPQARRVELCQNARHLVVHHGWQPLAEGCTPGPDDTVIPLV